MGHSKVVWGTRPGHRQDKGEKRVFCSVFVTTTDFGKSLVTVSVRI